MTAAVAMTMVRDQGGASTVVTDYTAVTAVTDGGYADGGYGRRLRDGGYGRLHPLHVLQVVTSGYRPLQAVTHRYTENPAHRVTAVTAASRCNGRNRRPQTSRLVSASAGIGCENTNVPSRRLVATTSGRYSGAHESPHVPHTLNTPRHTH